MQGAAVLVACYAQGMTTPKSLFSPAHGSGPMDASQVERQLALEYLAEAWNSAEEDGLQSSALAHASLFAALATLVRHHGDEATADLIAQLPDRIRNGEYNLERVLQ
jgi:hypothetical protein